MTRNLHVQLNHTSFSTFLESNIEVHKRDAYIIWHIY